MSKRTFTCRCICENIRVYIKRVDLVILYLLLPIDAVEHIHNSSYMSIEETFNQQLLTASENNLVYRDIVCLI